MPTDLKILSGEIGGLALRLLRGELAAIEVRPDMVGGVLVFDGRGFALLRDAEAGPTAALSEAPRPRPEILSEKLRERRHVVMEIFRALPEERLTLGQIAEMPECAAFAATYPARKSAIHRVAEGLVREGLLVVETDRVSRNPLDRPTRYYKLA